MRAPLNRVALTKYSVLRCSGYGYKVATTDIFTSLFSCVPLDFYCIDGIMESMGASGVFSY